MRKPLKEMLKKIGGAHLLKEKANFDKEQLQEYWNDIVQDVEGDDIKIDGTTFYADYDYHSGALSWGDENSDFIFYMTPGYDGINGIPIEDGNTGKQYGRLPLKTTGDVKKDTKWYVNTIKKALPKILKKAK